MHEIPPGRQDIKWHVVLQVLGRTTDKLPSDNYRRWETWQDLDRQAAMLWSQSWWMPNFRCSNKDIQFSRVQAWALILTVSPLRDCNAALCCAPTEICSAVVGEPEANIVDAWSTSTSSIHHALMAGVVSLQDQAKLLLSAFSGVTARQQYESPPTI